MKHHTHANEKMMTIPRPVVVQPLWEEETDTGEREKERILERDEREWSE